MDENEAMEHPGGTQDEQPTDFYRWYDVLPKSAFTSGSLEDARERLRNGNPRPATWPDDYDMMIAELRKRRNDPDNEAEARRGDG